MSEKKVPLCKDCRWFEKSIVTSGWCNMALVTTDEQIVVNSCIAARRATEPCGPSGRLYEPKRKWWKWGKR